MPTLEEKFARIDDLLAAQHGRRWLSVSRDDRGAAALGGSEAMKRPRVTLRRAP